VHKYLVNHLKILHQDISIGNVMLSRPTGRENAVGLLVDFDYSNKIEVDSEDVQGDEEWVDEEQGGGDSRTGLVHMDANQDSRSHGDMNPDMDDNEECEVRERIWTVCGF
jgi:Fungal protein kinase